MTCCVPCWVAARAEALGEAAGLFLEIDGHDYDLPTYAVWLDEWERRLANLRKTWQLVGDSNRC